MMINLRGIVLIIAIVSCGCDKGNENQAPLPSSHSLSFSGLMESHAAVIDSIPDHPQSNTVIESLLSSLANEKGIGLDEAQTALALQFPDDNLGLYLLEQRCSLLRDENSEELKSYLEYMLSNSEPTAALHWATFYHTLSLYASTDSKQFLSLCAESISTKQPDQMNILALFSRAQYYRANDQGYLASIDVLHLLRDYTDDVFRKGMESSLYGILHDSGLYLEAGMLEYSVAHSSLASYFHDTLMGFKDVPIPENMKNSLDQFLSQSYQSPESTMNSQVILNTLRKGRLAVEDLNASESYRLFSLASDGAEELLKESPNSTVLNSIILGDALLASSLKLKQLFLNEWKIVRDESNKVSTLAAEKLTRKLCHQSVAMAMVTSNPEDIPAPEIYWEAMASRLEIFENLNDRENIEYIYHSFEQLFPDTPMTATLSLELADRHRSQWNTPQRALEIYQKIINTFTDSAESTKAELQQIMCLYELQQFEESYEKAMLFTSQHSSHNDLPLAQYMGALAMSSMGMSDDAVVLMQQIFEESPKSPVAARALFFIASTNMLQQNYAEAKGVFEDITQRYPESPSAKQARDYAKRLDTIALTK